MPYYPPQPEKTPDEQKENEEKKHLLEDNRFRIGVLVVCLCLIVYGAVRLIIYGADWATSRRTARELKASVEETAQVPELTESITAELTAGSTETVILTQAPATETPAETAAPPETPVISAELPPVRYPGGMNVVSRIQQLRKKSQYIIGWLTMDDLDEPVVLKDNEFFLNHDAKGNRNYNGAIFMDEDTGLMTRPYTILLYGHNMKTGAMFGNLKKYEDAAYCQKHRILQFDTLYEEGYYVVFAVSTIRLTPGTARYFGLEGLQSLNRETRKEAIRKFEILSAHPVIVDVNEEDQILLLVTCVGDDDERLILAARMRRDNETKDKVTLKQTGK